MRADGSRPACPAGQTEGAEWVSKGFVPGVTPMPRGSKDKYTANQKRKAEHIEDSYKAKGVSEDEAEARAWATVNKQSGGGERAGGSGRRKSAAAKADDREESARRAVATRRGVPRARSAPERQEKTRAQLM